MILEESSWGLNNYKTYPKLDGKIEADIVIVGAGIAGIFNAYILGKAGMKVVVLEKNEKILQNATLHTTGFITKLVDSSFAELSSLFGEDRAKLAWQSGQDAINLIAKIVKDENIDCEFKFVPIYTYAQNENELAQLSDEYATIKKAGPEAVFSADGSKLNFKNAGYLQIEGQAMFHPLKFAQQLANLAESSGVKIFADSEVLSIVDRTVKTQRGQVQGGEVLIATYSPLKNEGTRFKKGMYKSYVYEVQIGKGQIPEGMYLDMQNPYHYFRIDSYDTFDRMIIGGEDHREDIKISPDKNFDALERYLRALLRGNAYKITRKWSGKILESTDGLPYIGEIKPHTYVMTAFSGSGMIYAPLSAMILRDLIQNKENPYIHLYAPGRTQTIKQVGTKALDYISEFFGGAFKNFFS